MEQYELLAPAGDLDSVQTALRFGADAVYVGGRLMQLRAKRAGFSDEGLRQALALAHGVGKRLYVTVNAFANHQEIENLKDYAKSLWDMGVDAVIVSDLGAIAIIKESCPDLELHVSTQANCMNYRTAKQYYDMGAKRIVLARELNLEEIALIRAHTPKALELEAFVHGAMCMAYSGRCLLSSFLTGRSGNRGVCAQTCRWNYRLQEEKRPNEYYDVEQYETGAAILSSYDLCALPVLERLKKAGITSFKIEGRMKSAYYIAGAVSAYRLALDGGNMADALAQAEAVSHRPYCTGFYEGPIQGGGWDGQYISSCRFVGRVIEREPDGWLTVEAKNRFSVGDTLELMHPYTHGQKFTLTELTNHEGERIAGINYPRSIVRIRCLFPGEAGDFLRKPNEL